MTFARVLIPCRERETSRNQWRIATRSNNSNRSNSHSSHSNSSNSNSNNSSNSNSNNSISNDSNGDNSNSNNSNSTVMKDENVSGSCKMRCVGVYPAHT